VFRAILVVENLPAIEAFRESLPETQRRRLNHPNAIWHRWRASRSAVSAVPRRECVKSDRSNAPHGKPIGWPADVIERAAQALRENRSDDHVVVALAVLRAAIRGAADLAELLDPPQQPAVIRPPRRPAKVRRQDENAVALQTA
jgi:hypothetical protein